MTKNKNLSVIDYDDLQSKTMDWLRFPLMVAVCSIHVSHQVLIDMHPSVAAHSVYFLISQVLARLAVPLFFIISGYYFFYNKKGNECIFNKETYIAKLKKRLRTLLMPYLFWNFVILCIYFVGKLYLEHTFMSISEILSAFCYYNGNYNTIAVQFWFIRDLMIVCIISPILYFLLKKGKLLTILAFFALWMSPVKWSPVPMVAIFFFSLGAYFSINGKNIIQEIARLPKIPLYAVAFILMVVDLIINEPPATTVHSAANNTYIHNIFILFGIAAVLNIIAECFRVGKLKSANKQLANASFFLFAVHLLPLGVIFNKLPAMFLPHNDFTFLLIYLLSVPLVAVISVWLYKLLKKYFPKFTAIITGGR